MEEGGFKRDPNLLPSRILYIPPFFLSFEQAPYFRPPPPPPIPFLPPLRFSSHSDVIFPPPRKNLKRRKENTDEETFPPLLLLLLLVARRFGENLEGESQTKEGTAFPGTQEK